MYSDVAIFPRFGGKRDVTHLIYLKIKPYLISLLFWQRRRGFKLFPQQNISDEIKFQNASKRQIKIIYLYVIKTLLYKIIAGDSQTHNLLTESAAIMGKYQTSVRLRTCIVWMQALLLTVIISTTKFPGFRQINPCIILRNFTFHRNAKLKIQKKKINTSFFFFCKKHATPKYYCI